MQKLIFEGRTLWVYSLCVIQSRIIQMEFPSPFQISSNSYEKILYNSTFQ